jgi:glutaminyl-tRNA synthetase
METPPKGFHRLAPGQKVRLRHAYIVTCTHVVKDPSGDVVEVHCTHDPATRGGVAQGGVRVEGTIHWVSAKHAKDVEVRIYDRLFRVENPGADDRDFLLDLNPQSLEIVRAKAEPMLGEAKEGDRFQFERVGYFYADPDSKPGAPVWNRTVALKDSWARVVAKAGAPTMRLAPFDAGSAGAPPAPGAEAKRELSSEAKALVETHAIGAEEARVLAQDAQLGEVLKAALATADGKKHAKAVASILVNEVRAELRARKLDAPPFDATAVVELVALLAAGSISSKQAKDVLAEMFATKKTPRAIVEAKGMKQIADPSTLAPIVEAVLAENGDAVARFRAGNANVLGALVGMVMKRSGGQANPKLVTDLLKQKLG